MRAAAQARQPPEEKLKKLKALCGYLGITVDLSSNKMFAKSIERIKECCDEAEKELLMTLFRKLGVVGGMMG